MGQLEDLAVVQRLRHALVARQLTVLKKQLLAKGYARITFGGADLKGFISSSFDDHVKLFIPIHGQPIVKPEIGSEGILFPKDYPKPVARDYTPRAFNEKEQTLEIDFLLHQHGPAGKWAQQVQVGDELVLAGPRGSMVIPLDLDWYLLAGDETALPAMTRRLAELPESAIPLVVLETADTNLKSLLDLQHPRLHLHYVQRNENKNALIEAVMALSLPTGQGFAWAATEYQLVSGLREVLTQHHGIDAKYIKVSSYWRA